MRKKIIAAAFVALGMGGLVAGTAPMASAQLLHIQILPSPNPCLRVDVVIGGTDIGPLAHPVCI